MDHTQVVSLTHWVSFSTFLWLYCWHYSMEKKKARKRINVYRLKKNIHTQYTIIQNLVKERGWK